MLLKITALADADIPKIMAIYAEGNRENAEYFYPDIPVEAGIAKEERKFAKMLREEFFTKSENAMYVWQTDGRWVAALRLTEMDEFYYLEALETRPDQRKQGYGTALLKGLCASLCAQGPVVIRDCVRKRNEASLRTHLAAGFVIERESGVEYPSGKTDERSYGMLYQK